MRDYSNSQFESRPLQGSVVDLVNQQEQINSNRRAEKLEKEKFQYLKDDRDRTWRENFLKENLKQQDFIDVKDADLNNLYAKTITKAMDQVGGLAMKLAYGQGTPEERVKMHLLNQTSDKLKALSEPIGDVIKKFNNGELHDDPELRSYLKNLGQADIDFNDKGELELVVQSENGSKRIPYSDAIKGVDGFKLIPKVDPYKGFMEFTKDIKPEETKTYDGFETTETKGVSTQLATQLAESYLYPSNKMSNALKSALKSAGFDPLNLTSDAASYALKLKDELAQQLINSRDRSNKEQYDWSAQQGSERNAENKRHNRASEAISQQNADTSAKNAETSRIKTMHDIKGNVVDGILTTPDSNSFNTARKQFGKLSENAFMLSKPLEYGTLSGGKKSDDLSNVKIHGIAYNEKGDIIIDIEAKDSNETVKRMAYKGGRSLEAQVASKLGVSSEELKQNIKGNTQTTNNDPLGIL